MKLTYDVFEKYVNREEHSLILSRVGNSHDSISNTGSSEEIALLCNYLENNSDILKVVLRYSKITYDDVGALTAITTLKTLNLSFSNLGDLEATSLATTKTLKSLKLNATKIRDEGVVALAANNSITKLSLRANNIGLVAVKALAKNVTIKILDIGSSNIDSVGAKALTANHTITSLNISWNNIGDKGVKALAANSNLKRLYVKGNHITAIGAAALATNASLTTLDISNNKIEAEGAIKLIANNTLRSLNIVYTGIGATGVEKFVDNLKRNTSLVKLSHSIEIKFIKKTIKNIISRNKMLPWFATLRHARLMSQAQRSDNCPLGMLPVEVFGIINNYAVGINCFSFFAQQFGARPSAQDLLTIKQMVLK